MIKNIGLDFFIETSSLFDQIPKINSTENNADTVQIISYIILNNNEYSYLYFSSHDGPVHIPLLSHSHIFISTHFP